MIEVKQSFPRPARRRFQQLLETSKNPVTGIEIYQMINGRFSRRIPETAFRADTGVIFAAGAKITGTAFLPSFKTDRKPTTSAAYCIASMRVARGLRYIPCSGHPTGTKQSEIQKITEGDIQ